MIRESTVIDRILIRRAKEVVEGSSSIQLVCPYCDDLQTEPVVAVWGGDVVYRCERTYQGAGCGRLFRGPR